MKNDDEISENCGQLPLAMQLETPNTYHCNDYPQ
jgi:hypothetical protein